MNMVLKTLGAIIGFGSILFLAYITTRFIGMKTSRGMKGKYISIVDSLSLGFDKQIYLVKAGEQYMLIASTGKNIEFLSSVSLAENEFSDTAESDNAFNFRELFEKYSKGFLKNKNVNSGKSKEGLEDEIKQQNEKEVFRGNLKRLRNITEKTENQIKNNGDDITNEEL